MSQGGRVGEGRGLAVFPPWSARAAECSPAMSEALDAAAAAEGAAAAAAAKSGDLAIGRRVIAAEMQGLASLVAALDANFAAAVDLCSQVKGRIVVTGVGKSGHVARKLAATLASTGAPAQFVHAAEAGHGDLGMIGPGDAILALSYSGESAELADIIAYSRRFKIALVAITGGPRSALAGAADIVLHLPDAAEACPMGLAPTTSTTMMMALGDALAIALLERKGFTHADFRLFHPGGNLGRRLLRVGEIMHSGAAIPLVGPDDPMSEAILVMTAKSFGCAGACDAEGRLVGIVTDGDLRRHMGRDLLSRTVGEVMRPGPKTIAASALAAEALGLMNRFAITALFVVDDAERPVGFLHLHDCLRAGIA